MIKGRVVRGGAWYGHFQASQCSARNWDITGHQGFFYATRRSFRLVRSRS